MLLQNLFKDLEELDPEVYERLNSRRSMFRLGAKVAAAAVPVALGSALNKAYAQTSDVAKIIDILNFALLAEYTDSTFYNLGLDAWNVIPAEDRLVWEELRNNENHHVSFVRKTIIALGGRPIERPQFDYTAKGKYPDPSRNYEVYKALAQAFEDTGVRAYKGQAPNLIDNDAILQAALQIHSVEARHAAVVRKLRNVPPWIEFADPEGSEPLVYVGEDNKFQNDPAFIINVAAISAPFGVGEKEATEAFDEPLSREQVTAIIAPFIVSM
ncbi:ferritin-like domain-containing protein [Tellurirhabdus rosea]|uniref:ferritin-like domain-containing protein n=1 Tax=Tellurirhabdus rosea TaxID=2674997 RepID=UPI00225596D5|nr:ferritin-like domain-containing protein [Tellurirhabdus rosea]